MSATSHTHDPGYTKAQSSGIRTTLGFRHVFVLRRSVATVHEAGVHQGEALLIVTQHKHKKASGRVVFRALVTTKTFGAPYDALQKLFRS